MFDHTVLVYDEILQENEKKNNWIAIKQIYGYRLESIKCSASVTYRNIDGNQYSHVEENPLSSSLDAKNNGKCRQMHTHTRGIKWAIELTQTSHMAKLLIYCYSQSTQIDINNDTHAIFHIFASVLFYRTKKKTFCDFAIFTRCLACVRKVLRPQQTHTINQMMMKKKKMCCKRSKIN